MGRVLYYSGRALQVIALIALPFSIWVGHLGHNERGAIEIFAGSTIVFFTGYLLTRFGQKI